MTKIARLVFTLALVLAAAYTATNASAERPAVPPWATKVALFYSGGNLRTPITCDWTYSDGSTGVSGSGDMHLAPRICDALWQLDKAGARSQTGLVIGSFGMSVLIHESLHDRVQPGFPNDDEIVVGWLGVRLVPDAMQRFFGVPITSRWGRKYVAVALGRTR